MSQATTLLIEIGTEELPPAGLERLAQNFLSGITKRFQAEKIPFAHTESFISPRRIAVRLTEVPVKQPDYVLQKKGPQLKSAFKEDGSPTPAALGFAKSCQVELSELKQLETDKGLCLVHEKNVPGQPISSLMAPIVSQALETLPQPKKMRWGDSDFAFIRPIHWIAIVHGSHAIETDVLGIQSGQYTQGHRHHFPNKVKINHADNYLNVLRDVKVLADYSERKDIIVNTATELVHKLGGGLILDPELLDTVTGLVEWPVPLVASFDKDMLKVPKEALISAMQGHQKCFPIVDKKGKLLPKFILVSNVEATDPIEIIKGNEKVMHARLEDARFFYRQDSEATLESHVAKLKKMTYQKALGSIYEKAIRVSNLATKIAEQINANPKWAQRAGMLCKADLVTHMVFEFPELQGIMGYYYAQKDQEPDEVAVALKEIYRPSSAKDDLPKTQTGLALALAERLDTLVGIFGVGLIPSGEKDPFALRRAAIGILRILIEKALPLDLATLIEWAATPLAPLLTEKDTPEKVLKFCFDRYKAWFQEQGITPQVIESVLALSPTAPYDMSLRTLAVNHFSAHDAAQSLASANKRVRNILEKNKISFNIQQVPPVKNGLLESPFEKDLHSRIVKLQKDTAPLIQQGEYQKALNLLANLKKPVDGFFDNVLVMADDEQLKQNRIHLLTQLYGLFMQIADISKLAL